MEIDGELKIRSGDAEALLNNSVLNAALDKIEQNAINDMVEARPDDILEAQSMAKAVRELKVELNIVFENGKDREERVTVL